MTPPQNRPPAKAPPTLKRPLIVSVAIHSVLVALAIFGLPHIMNKPDILEAVPVEVMTNAQIAELTTTNRPPVKAPPKEDPKKEPPPPKKEEPPKPPPKTDAAPPPPDDQLKEPPKPKDKPVEDKKGDLPKKEDKKKPDKKPIKKPEPKKEVKKDQQDDMDALLKNLAAAEPQSEDPLEETKSDAKPEPSPDVSRFSDVLTTSEKDAMASHYQPCWNIMSGGAGVDNMVVSIRFMVTAQNTLTNPQILDQGRYSSDTAFRAAADSAIRATRADRCSTLPPFMSKYSGQTVVLNFDPTQMF